LIVTPDELRLKEQCDKMRQRLKENMDRDNRSTTVVNPNKPPIGAKKHPPTTPK
jgi:hypothetical protein